MEQHSLTINDACKTTGIGRTKLFALMRSGEIPRRKLGRRTLILVEDLKAFLNSLPTSGEEVTL